MKTAKTAKTALITGITGQDGAYLAKFLLNKNYVVHGIKRRSSSFNTKRIDDIYKNENFKLHFGDLNDSSNLTRIVHETQPDEIYNLGAQSHVQVSFETPEYTANVDGLGALRLLDAIRQVNKSIRFYQASTSEMFGNVVETPQTEKTPFYPRSPYGVAKLYAYWITRNYRESYGIHASNGILFNHESPIRGETFVTKKITRSVARIKYGLEDCIYLGNLNAMRDWGHAKEFVEGMWLMLQQEKPDDYILATGKAASVRDFVSMAFNHAGISIKFEGENLNEVGIDQKTGNIIVRVDSKYYRPAEVDFLLGDPSKAKRILGWEAKISVEELCKEMVEYDLRKVREKIR